MASINDRLEIKKAKVIFIGEKIETKSGFKYQKIIITEVDRQFNQSYEITFEKDNVNLIKALKVGDLVTVHVFVKGRFHEKEGKKYAFTTFSGWSIGKL